MMDHEGIRTVATPRHGLVQAEVYWDGTDPANEGYAYRLTWDVRGDRHEETGPCDAADPWDDVYGFLGVAREDDDR